MYYNADSSPAGDFFIEALHSNTSGLIQFEVGDWNNTFEYDLLDHDSSTYGAHCSRSWGFSSTCYSRHAATSTNTTHTVTMRLIERVERSEVDDGVDSPMLHLAGVG